MGCSITQRERQRELRKKKRKQAATEREVENYFIKKQNSLQWKNEFGINDKTPCNAQILAQGGNCCDIRY